MTRASFAPSCANLLGRWRGPILLTVAVAMTACTLETSAADSEPELEFDWPEPSSHAETQTVDVRTPWGLRRYPCEPVDGFCLIEGDIAIPMASEDAIVPLSYATPELGRRWPGGVIPFEFAPDFRHPGLARAAMEDWSTVTPIRFRLRRAGDDAWIRLENALVPPFTSWTEGGIGMAGGQQTIRIQDLNREWKAIDPDAIQATIVHELGHAIGLFHEHSRPDREEVLEYDRECGGDLVSWWVDLTNSGENEDGVALGPYDPFSVMHYNSRPGTREDGTPCFNFVVRETGTPVSRSFTPTAGDVNTVWRMYATQLDINRVGEELGTSVLSHDFDLDGHEDLAIAAPGDLTSTGVSGGAVYLFKNTAPGFVPWKRLVARHPEARSQFGSALAAGDFDGDRVQDLAVGSPGRTVDGHVNAGMVHLFRIDRNREWALTARLTKADGLFAAAIERGDRFGHSLTAGDFYRPGRRVLAIGAPGARVARSSGRGGNVFVLDLHDGFTNLHRLRQLDAVDSRVGMAGWSLAAMPTAWDGRDSLIVSAPGGTTTCDSRRVFVLDPDPSWGAPLELAETVRAPSPRSCLFQVRCGGIFGPCPGPIAIDDYPNDAWPGFGAVIAAGDFSERVAGFWDLAVADGLGGPIRVYSRTSLDLTYAGLLPNPLGSETFGSAMEAGDTDGDGQDDLVVGVDDWDGQSGRVLLFRGGTSAGTPMESTPSHILRQGTFGDEDGDRLGASVAVVEGDGTGTVVAGAPGEAPAGDPSSGAAYLWEGTPERTPVTPDTRITQESRSAYAR